jgi:hypothetical protein
MGQVLHGSAPEQAAAVPAEGMCEVWGGFFQGHGSAAKLPSGSRNCLFIGEIWLQIELRTQLNCAITRFMGDQDECRPCRSLLSFRRRRCGLHQSA